MLRRVSSWIIPVTLGFAFVLLPVFADESKILAGGTWTKKGYAIEGSWNIVERAGERVVVLSDDFKTKKGPDLKVFLSPTSLTDLGDRNATQSSIFLGALTSHRGRQEFPIPADVDLDRFATVIVHCEKYSKLWGGARLSTSGR